MGTYIALFIRNVASAGHFRLIWRPRDFNMLRASNNSKEATFLTAPGGYERQSIKYGSENWVILFHTKNAFICLRYSNKSFLSFLAVKGFLILLYVYYIIVSKKNQSSVNQNPPPISGLYVKGKYNLYNYFYKLYFSLI